MIKQLILNNSVLSRKENGPKYYYALLTIQIRQPIIYTQLNVKTDLFRTIKLSRITQFSSI